MKKLHNSKINFFSLKNIDNSLYLNYKADDIALAAYVLNSKVDPEIVKRNWAGDSDVLDVIQQILAVADEMLGSGLFAKIKKLL